MPERLLPVSGTIRMPPGVAAADVTVTYLGVLRGGGLVSGGTLKAFAGPDGALGAEGGPLRLQAAYPGERVEQHPFAKVGVSYRGTARGYEFLVDLVVEPGATSIPLDRVSGNSELMSAAQVQSVQGLIADLGTAKAQAQAAAQSVTKATLDLTGERERVEEVVGSSKTQTAAAKAAADLALRRATSLGGIRSITVTDTYVELYDASEGARLVPSTHTTPNGYVLETITIREV